MSGNTRGPGASHAIRLAQFVRSFHLGGTEGQALELVRGLHGFDLLLGVLRREGPLLTQALALGHLPASFPLGPSYAHPATLRQMARVARWLQRNQVEVVHAHDLYTTLLVAPVAKLLRRGLVVGRLDMAHFQSGAQRALLAQFTRMADAVVVNAEAIRRMLVAEEGVHPARVHVIHNGLDLRRFDALASAGLRTPLPDTGGNPVVVQVANMNHPVKRQEDLLEALARLAARGTVLHAWFIGDGPRRAEVESRRDALGLQHTAHFLGHRLDVPAVLSRANVGVLCSSAEGLSNAVMEGMAAGLPMVVTRVGGNPELIAHGERGLVVEPHRPAQLAEALAELLAEPGRARQMGAKARTFVQEKLSVQQLCARHAEIYRAVASRASVPTTSEMAPYPDAFSFAARPESSAGTIPGPS
jgi:glycosyltransferase involved in cell wall biosynthesis